MNEFKNMMQGLVGIIIFTSGFVAANWDCPEKIESGVFGNACRDRSSGIAFLLLVLGMSVMLSAFLRSMRKQ